MSHFDYPRINFSGSASLDPGTGNNGFFLPMVIFNPLKIQAVLPPRVYLEEEYIAKGYTLDDIRKALPAGAVIKEDVEPGLPNAPYVEISPIDNDELFEEWAITPLGQFPLDKGYAPLYDRVYVPYTKKSLTGELMGYWNFYGGMGFSYRGVQVSSVALDCRAGEETIYFPESIHGAPPEVVDLLGASLTMNNILGDDSTNACMMIDLLPEMAIYTQLFCDSLALYRDDTVFFKGKPLKGSLRAVNVFRVVNENMPYSGSGQFYTVLPLENIQGGEASPIIEFFQRYGNPRRKLKGLFIRQVLSEIAEYRDIDYHKHGKTRNPASAALAGSIGPWYEEEPRSWAPARWITGQNPFIFNRSSKFDAPVCVLPPAAFVVDVERQTLTLDLLHAIPMQNRAGDSPPFQNPIGPAPQDHATYFTYPLGAIEFLMADPEGKHPAVVLGELQIDQEHLPLDTYPLSGGFFHFPLPDNWSAISNWNLAAYPKSNSPNPQNQYWGECPVVVISDECGLYADQGDEPLNGYRSYGEQREDCRIRIYERGLPKKDPVQLSILEFRSVYSGADVEARFFRKGLYHDGDRISFPTDEPLNAIYVFQQGEVHQLPHGNDYPQVATSTGFFISVKVLPTPDYRIYFDPNHPEYPAEIRFEQLYQAVLRTYALLTPVMKFPAAGWDNRTMAAAMIERTDPKLWDSPLYMPASRDLSAAQRRLILRWASKFPGLQVGELTTPAQAQGTGTALIPSTLFKR